MLYHLRSRSSGFSVHRTDATWCTSKLRVLVQRRNGLAVHRADATRQAPIDGSLCVGTQQS